MYPFVGGREVWWIKKKKSSFFPPLPLPCDSLDLLLWEVAKSSKIKIKKKNLAKMKRDCRWRHSFTMTIELINTENLKLSKSHATNHFSVRNEFLPEKCFCCVLQSLYSRSTYCNIRNLCKQIVFVLFVNSRPKFTKIAHSWQLK